LVAATNFGGPWERRHPAGPFPLPSTFISFMCAIKSQFSVKVLGTEPDFAQKLGTEPNFAIRHQASGIVFRAFDT